MKKLLNILTLATLSTSAIPTVNLVLNSSVVKNLSLKNNSPVNDNPFKTPMTGTTGAIKSLTTDRDGNIYAGGENGTVYKSNGTNAFTAISGTSGKIMSLAVDNQGNIYAGSLNGTVYKCLTGQTNFTAMTGTTGEIMSLAVDNQGNILLVTIMVLFINQTVQMHLQPFQEFKSKFRV